MGDKNLMNRIHRSKKSVVEKGSETEKGTVVKQITCAQLSTLPKIALETGIHIHTTLAGPPLRTLLFPFPWSIFSRK